MLRQKCSDKNGFETRKKPKGKEKYKKCLQSNKSK